MTFTFRLEKLDGTPAEPATLRTTVPRRRRGGQGVPAKENPRRLQPLLELRVESVLPTHGAPTDRAALERALSWFSR
jgi:hypothetical protein